MENILEVVNILVGEIDDQISFEEASPSITRKIETPKKRRQSSYMRDDDYVERSEISKKRKEKEKQKKITKETKPKKPSG